MRERSRICEVPWKKLLLPHHGLAGAADQVPANFPDQNKFDVVNSVVEELLSLIDFQRIFSVRQSRSDSMKSTKGVAPEKSHSTAKLLAGSCLQVMALNGRAARPQRLPRGPRCSPVSFKATKP
jgi:hypothetical protein